MMRTAVSVRVIAGAPVALVDHARAERSGLDQVERDVFNRGYAQRDRDGRRERDRMDRGDLEPGDGLRQGFAGLRSLLRRDLRGTVAWDSLSPLRAGVLAAAL